MMNENHRPDPAFREHLEWQISTAARRRERFDVARSARRLPTGGLIALILISVFCGAAGVLATEQVQDERQKQIQLVQLEAELTVVKLRVELARERLEEARLVFESGLMSEEEYRRAEQELHSVDTERQMAQLRIEEARMTGRAPDDRLTSPVTGERDFVSDRIRLQIENARSEVALTELVLQRQASRFEAGLVPQLTVMDSRATAMKTIKELENLEMRLRLRQRFVAGELTAEQVEREALLASLRNELEGTRLMLGVVSERYQRLVSLHESGGIEEVEVRRAQLSLMSFEVLVQSLQAKLRRLTEAGAPPPA